MNSHLPILLTEDNTNDVELIVSALKKNLVLNQVIIARHGGEALDYLYRRGTFQDVKTGLPLVIIMDLNMPVVNGLEVLKQIKQDPALRLIPTVILSSSAQEQDVVACYNLGVNAYVVKPVAFHDFLEVISQIGYFWARMNQPPPRLEAPL